MRPAPVVWDATARAALEDKYTELVALRRAPADLPRSEAMARMRALATRFPGALRELDRAELRELERRKDALSSLGPAAPTPWMLASHAFHRALRDLLHERRGAGARRPHGGVAPKAEGTPDLVGGGRFAPRLVDRAIHRTAEDLGWTAATTRDALFSHLTGGSPADRACTR
jgi:hypothetical protein